MGIPHLRTRELFSPSFYVECPHKLFEFCMGDLSILLHLSIYSIIYLFIPVQTHKYLFYALGYNPVLLYSVAQTIPALAVGSSFSWFLCSFDICT